jgi:hypothetical protein
MANDKRVDIGFAFQLVLFLAYVVAGLVMVAQDHSALPRACVINVKFYCW